MKRPYMGSRFFSDLYDSVTQRHFPVLYTKHSSISDLYIARLRFDALLSKTIVLTDAQLLDGAFTLRMPPSSLTARIARINGEPLPIEVRSRAASLSDSLLLFVKRPNEEKLRGFTFSSVEDEQERMALKETLESTPANDVKSWHDILNIMKKVGVNSSNVDIIEQGWAKWIEAQEKNEIIVKQWEGEYHIESALSDSELLQYKLKTEEGRQVAKWVYAKRHDRSSIDVKLSTLKAELIGNSLQDILLIESWYNHGYNIALAWRYNCGNFESISDMSYKTSAILQKIQYALFSAEDGSQPEVSTFLELPKDFWLKLATLPNGKFRELFWTKQNLFQGWWESGDQKKLRKAIEPLVEEIAKTSRRLDISPLTDIPLAIGAGAISFLLNYLISGVPGALTSGLVGPMLPLAVKYLVIERILKRPVKKISQRILEIAKERQRDE